MILVWWRGLGQGTRVWSMEFGTHGLDEFSFIEATIYPLSSCLFTDVYFSAIKRPCNRVLSE